MQKQHLIIKVSVEEPDIYSTEHIKRYLELENLFSLSKQEKAEKISLKRQFAHPYNRPDCIIDVREGVLFINI